MTTNESRCEPPPEWRERDGWHVLASPSPHGYERPWFWVPASDGGQARWNDLGCPAQAYCNGYRYLAPVTPPATVAALAEALEWMIANDDTNEGDTPLPEHGNRTWNEINDYWIDGLNKARAVLALYRGEAGR